MNFSVAGTYTIAMRSNDGVDLNVSGERGVYGPEAQSDRFADPVPVRLRYPARIRCAYSISRNG